MSARKLGLVAVLALDASGCTAVRMVAPMSPAEREVFAAEASPKPSLCFETLVPIGENEPTGVAVDYQDANHLLAALWRTGFFSRVVFAQAPDAGCDVFLSARELHQRDLGYLVRSLPELGLTTVSWGLIPYFAYANGGLRVEVSAADRDAALLVFSCQPVMVFGAWLPPLLGLLPGWTRLPVGTDPLGWEICSDGLARFLLAKRESLWSRDAASAGAPTASSASRP